MTTPVYCIECGATEKNECDCLVESFQEPEDDGNCPEHGLLLDDGVCYDCEEEFEEWEWGDEFDSNDFD